MQYAYRAFGRDNMVRLNKLVIEKDTIMRVKKTLPLPLLLLALLLAACSGANKASEGGGKSACGLLAADEICVKIGSGEPKTGGIAHIGKDNENGVQLAINDINAKGDLVIGGKKVKLVMIGEDDASDPKQGTIVAQKLVDAKVAAVVGHDNSGVSIPANLIYSAAGLVQVSPASTDPDYTLKSKRTPQGSVSAYRVVATDTEQAPALAKYLSKQGVKSIAVIDDATQYGKGLADQFEKAMKDAGVSVLAREAVNDKTADFKALLTKVKALNPDYIFWGGMDDTAATLVKQMKELGMHSQLASADGVCTDKFIELSGAAGKGVICSQAGMPLSKMPKGAEFNANYEKTFPGQKVQIYSPFAYDATYAIVEAMKIANSVEPEAIAAAMPKVNFVGLIGPIAFDQKGDIKNGAISIFEVKDKLELLEIIQ